MTKNMTHARRRHQKILGFSQRPPAAPMDHCEPPSIDHGAGWNHSKPSNADGRRVIRSKEPHIGWRLDQLQPVAAGSLIWTAAVGPCIPQRLRRVCVHFQRQGLTLARHPTPLSPFHTHLWTGQGRTTARRRPVGTSRGSESRCHRQRGGSIFPPQAPDRSQNRPTHAQGRRMLHNNVRVTLAYTTLSTVAGSIALGSVSGGGFVWVVVVGLLWIDLFSRGLWGWWRGW